MRIIRNNWFVRHFQILKLLESCKFGGGNDSCKSKAQSFLLYKFDAIFTIYYLILYRHIFFYHIWMLSCKCSNVQTSMYHQNWNISISCSNNCIFRYLVCIEYHPCISLLIITFKDLYNCIPINSPKILFIIYSNWYPKC